MIDLALTFNFIRQKTNLAVLKPTNSLSPDLQSFYPSLVVNLTVEGQGP